MLSACSEEKFSELAVALVDRLAKKEWLASRSSAATLIPLLYKNSNAAGKEEMRKFNPFTFYDMF